MGGGVRLLAPCCAPACSWAEPFPACRCRHRPSPAQLGVPQPHLPISPSSTLHQPTKQPGAWGTCTAWGQLHAQVSSVLAWCWKPPPPPSPDVQHVGDDAHAPHVRGVGDLLVVDHLGGEEFGGAKVHLQLLLGVVPAARAGESAGGGQAAPPHPCPPPGRHCSPQPSRASQGEPGLAAVARAGAHSGSRVSQHLKGSWGRRVGGRQGEGMEPRRGEDGTFEPAQSR